MVNKEETFVPYSKRAEGDEVSKSILFRSRESRSELAKKKISSFKALASG